MLANVLEIHDDLDTWINPEKFDPYQHIDENGEFIASQKIMAFGMGYRMCPGEHLPRKEIFFVFVKLLQSFWLKTDESLPS